LVIRVRILGGPTREVGYREGMKVIDVLRSIGVMSSEYVVVKNGRIVAEDEPIEDGDELVLYPVVSGG
jgi:sulfur carrier protein